MCTIIDLEYELQRSTLSYYNNPVVPRNVVQTIMENNIQYNNKFRAYFETSTDLFPDVFTPTIRTYIKKIFDSVDQVFDKFSSENKRFARYIANGLMIVPVEYHIGYEFKGEKNDKKVEVKGVYIPLQWSLKALLEIPGVMDTLLSYMNEVQDDDIFCNFIQGELWKNFRLTPSSECIWIPLFVFGDKFECGHPLGPQAGKNKLCGIYTNIPCLPSEISAQLDFILLTALFRANDRKKFGNRAVFMKLIKELNKIHDEGLKINTSGKQYLVRFVSGLVRGDNL